MLFQATTIRLRSDQLGRKCLPPVTLERVASCSMQYDYIIMRYITRLARSPLQVWKATSSRLGWIVPRQAGSLGMEVIRRRGHFAFLTITICRATQTCNKPRLTPTPP